MSESPAPGWPASLEGLWSWQARGACRATGVGLFFSPDGEREPARQAGEQVAKAICARCPVVDVCAAYAVAARERYGVWGGLSEADRRRIWQHSDQADRQPRHWRALAGGGEPLTMCVGGEAGVGKTRLVTRFAGQVRAAGGQVLLGGCIELGETALPYAPVAQALRGLGRGPEPAALEKLVGPGRPLLARLLPELGQGEESTSAGLAVGSSAQARLFEAVLALLERLADQSPTVLVVEDLHWADRSTLDLLAFLVRNLQAGLLLVLTYRSDELHRRHPLRPFLAELDRSGRAERLEVGRFDRVDLADLLAGILGRRPDDDLVERIYRRSEGNAFFAEELLAATQQGDSNGRGLPPSLQNVLLTRVQVLPDEAQATLRIVAAASGRVEHDLLAAVSELPEADLLAALRAAVAHQVLVPDPATETYALRHALTQEALYAELLPGERARLHAAFARVLAERPDLAEPNRFAAPARLAYHWVRAHDPARALPAAVEAGLQSEAAYGFADAQRHFETALELWDQVADAEQRVGLDRTAVLHHAAESAYRAGERRPGQRDGPGGARRRGCGQGSGAGRAAARA